MKETTEKVDLAGPTTNSPKLHPGKAGLKKKPSDKYKIQDLDKKALETSVFVKQVDMFDSKWNHFKDTRGWTWIQENKNELV